jgi:membrane protein DedA with SNARE-associated domain
MPFGRFIAFATAGSILWIGGLAVLGRDVGSQWEAWRKHLEYVDYAAVVLLVVLVVVLVVRWRQGRNESQRQAEPATDVVAD